MLTWHEQSGQISSIRERINFAGRAPKNIIGKNPTKFIILLPFCNELVPLPLIPSYKSFNAASLNDGFLTVQSVELRI